MSPVAKVYVNGEWVPVGSGPTVVQNAGRLGDVSWWPFATLPDDAVACEGQEITAAAWPELHALLVANGNPFGTANGNPLIINLKGRFPVGRDTAQIEFDTLLEMGGAKAVLLTGPQSGIQAHAHTYYTNIQHGDGTIVSGEALTSGLQAGGRRRYVDGTQNAGPADATQSHPNLPPYTVGRWIMRARTVFQGLGSNFATEDHVATAAEHPVARMHKLGDQVVSAQTPTKLTGFTKTFQSHANMVDTANSRLIFPSAGTYRVAGTLAFMQSTSNIPVLSAILRHNGNTVADVARPYVPLAGHGCQIPPATTTIQAAAGDYLELFAYWAFGSSGSHTVSGFNTNFYVFMEIERIRGAASA